MNYISHDAAAGVRLVVLVFCFGFFCYCFGLVEQLSRRSSARPRRRGFTRSLSPDSGPSAPGRDGDVAAEAVQQNATQLEARETSETAVR